MTKRFALAAMAAALLTTTALAQSAPPASSTAPAMKPAQSTAAPAMIQTNSVGKWRTSKLIGLDVYNAANEKIGDVNELITDSTGKIDTVVVGVGGFLGIGEHDVGIAFSQLKFAMEPVKTSSTSATTTTGSGAATTTTTSSSAAKDYPDHAMVNMTKDQLKAMPAFKYASDSSPSQVPTSPTAR
jgi:sporulation protein YlmC with PRC-barrel domain